MRKSGVVSGREGLLCETNVESIETFSVVGGVAMEALFEPSGAFEGFLGRIAERTEIIWRFVVGNGRAADGGVVVLLELDLEKREGVL